MRRSMHLTAECPLRTVRRLSTVALLTGLVLVAVPGRAHAIAPKIDVARNAEVAVRGKVVGTRSAWDEKRRLIYTYTTVRVERTLKGRAQAYVTIKQAGGTVGKLRLVVNDQPAFARNEQVDVYLTRQDSDFYRVVLGPGAKKHLSGPVARAAPDGVDANATTGYAWDGTKWGASALPMEYYINTAFTWSESSIILDAFDTWENDAGSSMDYRYLGTTSRSAPTYDGYNVMTKGSTGGSIATTYYWAYGTRMVEVDIVYDYYAWPWSISGEAGKFDLQNIATHENGHTLVLGDLYDSANTEQTMYGYAGYGETKKRTLNWGDIAGIAAIYQDSGPPPDVSGFAATAGDTRVTLAWRNPSVSDFAGVLVVRKTGSAPANRTDGVQVYNGSGTSHADTTVDNGTTYYYRAFAYDQDGYYAPGVIASATPRLPSTLTSVATPTTIRWGGSARIDSALDPGHTPTPQVKIQQSSSGSTWATLAAMFWNEGIGAYEMSVAPQANTYYRASWDGDADHLPAVSSSVRIYVTPRLSTYIRTIRLKYGRTLYISGYASPRHDGKKVAFYYERYRWPGVWTWAASRYTRLGHNTSIRSRARSVYRPSGRGTWRVRFRFGDSDHRTAETYSRTFRVY